jgi:probable rRNA maturation factor
VLWSDLQDRIALPFLQELLPRVTEVAARRLSIPENAELSITIVDDEQISRLNRDYRGLEGPTDVLSFSLLEGEGPDRLPESMLLLGDVIVSAERAVSQAESYGHSLEREIAFLVVHGILHILGHDHGDEMGEMGTLTEQILGETGLSR